MIAKHHIPTGYDTAVIPIAAVASGDADISVVVFEAFVKTKIIHVDFIPDTAQSGTDTNYRTMSIVDKKADASGTTELGTAWAQTSGNDLTAFVAQNLVAITDEEEVAAGHVLVLKNAKTSSGVPTPAGKLIVVTWPSDSTPA